MRRRRRAAALLWLGLMPAAAVAADPPAGPPWPARPVSLVVAYPPGAITDTVGRRVAEQLGTALGAAIVVENRGGAGGNVAGAYVARAAPDGHTLLFTSYGNLIIAAAAKLPVGFDPFKDLAPVGMVGPMTVVLLVRPDLPVRNLAEFVRHVAAHPGQLNFASVGFGSSYHLLIEQMMAHGRLSMNHVPYRGGAAAMTDFLGGRVQATLATWLFARPYMTDGSARPIAVANAARAPVAPELPTVAEAVPGAAIAEGLGLFAPAGTPAPVIARLNAALRAILAAPAMHGWLETNGVTPQPGPPEAFTAEMRPAAESLARLLRETQIRLE
ncbi:Bug family tripartite tricarboxylate transporter substrate binding protein [Roseicella frigidaeris]|uniref:Tripartite tricarboxylate transporter substrate binding protein n=1 Tax=Roseicella frigidaeris TaxID=2230885 RepID=A0A327MAT0_9PROT|nr:tripartite tricarboxylate transporter substrate binding protein [Roseicella frigidaeris]RAI57238.1 tripartite tricarboxylate transporter substrate binding protein [Roseicella frigidaeris]